MKCTLIYCITLPALLLFFGCGAPKRTIVDAPLLPHKEIIVPKGAVPVTVKKEGEGFQLSRDGKPYYINGVGYSQDAKSDYYHMKILADMGGNSVRTWGVGDSKDGFKDTKEFMDKAYEFGLTVDLGLWINHERHGFDYNNKEQVEELFLELKQAVETFKDHPALLMWNLGNEVTMSVNYDSYNKKVWDFIGRVDKMIKQIDGKHPTLTTIHDPDARVIKAIQERAPGIDILGINKYGGLGGAMQSAQDVGWKKAIVITEFGTMGGWEVPQTQWGAPLEPYGIKKAILYKQGIRAIKENKICVGSYAFVWGERQEITKTWYALIVGRGRTIAATDELSRGWLGKYPDNRAPFIHSFLMNGMTEDRSVIIGLGAPVEVKVVAKDTEDGEDLIYEFWLLAENQVRTSGGDFQQDPPKIEFDNLSEDGGEISFDAPVIPGQYRLFVRVYDSKGKVCDGNFPFLVQY